MAKTAYLDTGASFGYRWHVSLLGSQYEEIPKNASCSYGTFAIPTRCSIGSEV